MTAKHKRALKIVVLGVGLGLGARAIWTFPWKDTYLALLQARLGLLAVAAVVNLLSLVVKGTSWHLLLKPLFPHRWSSAQIGNLVGTTVNCLSVSVAGEAARIHYVVKRDGLSWPAGTASVAWARLTEGIGLAFFLIVAPSLLHLPPYLGTIRFGAAVILIAFCGALFSWKNWNTPVRLPGLIRAVLTSLLEIGSWRRVIWPVLLGVSNWVFQWATFHLALVAINGRSALAVSFMALLATNLGGLLRLTPANVGVFQAAMVTSLAGFGVPSDRAMAASLALQALQVLPVIVIGLMFMTPWRAAKLSSRTPLPKNQNFSALPLSSLEKAENPE